VIVNKPELSEDLLDFLSSAQESLKRLSRGKQDLGSLKVDELWDAPFALLSHNTETPPCFIYSNARALEAFESTWEDWIGRPSLESAEEDEREARERLLREVEGSGYSEGYSGVRISAKGRRFRIEGALLWNVEREGVRIGQAAMFSRWTPL
jgi:hypothetical protein